jgi:hypothetical protein
MKPPRPVCVTAVDALRSNRRLEGETREGEVVMTGLRWLVISVGVILAVLSLFADVLKLGAAPGFGWKQIVGLVVGLALIGYGFLGL